MTDALDLFCGAAGGWSLGLHRAGIQTTAACEIDDWRRAVFSTNFPDVRMYGDVRDITASRLLSDIGRLPDWIVGSPPCQDASYANVNGKGVDGERTGLFFEAIRIISECRPAWACFENVPGLRTRGADRVLAELEALGYACWPLVVGAVLAGAPHRRQRVWIVAADLSSVTGWLYQGPRHEEGATDVGGYCVGQDAADATSWRCEAGRGPDKPQPEPACGAASDTHGAGLAQWQSVGGDALEELPPAIRAVAAGSGWNGGALGLARSRRVADGLSAGMDSRCISAYGDAVLPQITEAIARSIIAVSPPLAGGGGSVARTLSGQSSE